MKDMGGRDKPGHDGEPIAAHAQLCTAYRFLAALFTA
jgi:hypothetical protein